MEKPTMNFGIYYCAIRDTNMGSKNIFGKKKVFLTKSWKTCFIVCAFSSWKTFRGSFRSIKNVGSNCLQNCQQTSKHYGLSSVDVLMYFSML